ncbi:MAG: hypothetical protein ABWX57_09555 [Aeromicrobium sp.]
MIASAVVVILLGGVAGGLMLKRGHDASVREDRASAAARETAAAEEKAADAARSEQEEADEIERSIRRDAVRDLEKNIVKSARKVVKTGYFDGPILKASCTATGGGSSDDLTAITGTFDCLAVTKENADGTMSGYGYDGTIDWDSGTLGWEVDN